MDNLMLYLFVFGPPSVVFLVFMVLPPAYRAWVPIGLFVCSLIWVATWMGTVGRSDIFAALYLFGILTLSWLYVAVGWGIGVWRRKTAADDRHTGDWWFIYCAALAIGPITARLVLGA